MKLSQEARLESMFKARPNLWIPLNMILDMRISQYGRAVHSLRNKRGMKIENRTEYDRVSEMMHSWFRYVPAEKQIEMAI